MAESPEQEAQRLVNTYSQLRTQLEYSMNVLSQIQGLLEGLSISSSVIEELQNKDEDHEIILPIGNFAYVKARIPRPDNVLVSIGRNILVERDSKQASNFIRKKREEIQQQQDAIKKTIDQYTTQLEQIEDILAAYQEQDHQPPNSL